MLHFNVHRHGGAIPPDELAVVNRRPGEPVGDASLFSFGVHPWEADAPDGLEWLEQALSHPRAVAVGETGLDRIRGPALDIQTQVFLRQLEVAKSRRLPVIIHCVRAFEELIQAKKLHDTGTLWVLHGFRGKPDLARRLLDAGLSLSFGAAALKPTPSLRESIALVPFDRLFLETDEADIPVARVYAAVAALKGVEIEALAARLSAFPAIPARPRA